MHSKKLGPAEVKSSVSSQQAEKSHDNFGISALTSCLVDAEGNTAAGAGRARRKALGVSALIQFCTLTAILIVPLFATGTRLILRPTDFVPLPPYGGAPRHEVSNPQRPSMPPERRPRNTFSYPQIQMPTQPTTRSHSLDDSDLKIGTNDSRQLQRVPGGGDGLGEIPNILSIGESGSQPPRPEPTTVSPARKSVSVSQGVELARLIHRIEPVYPQIARQMRKEGTVELRATISSDGVVTDVQVLNGDPLLALSARDAVTQWRFRPTLLNGVAVEVVTFITVNFHIGQ